MNSWKTTLAGFLSGAGLLFAQLFPVWNKWGLLVAGLGSLLTGLWARDNDKSSEDVGAKSKPPGLTDPRRLVLILPLAALLALGLGGCQTPAASRVDTAAVISEVAAATGAQVWLKDHPGDRAYFVTASQAIGSLLEAEDYSPSQFRAALLALPIRELRSDTTWLQPIMAAVKRGLDSALAP